MKNIICLSIFLLAGAANADIVQYSDRTSFESLGNISQNYGFEDFGSGFYFPGSPWTSHGITYQTGSNLIIGSNTSYNPVSNVFAYNNWTPILASISQNPDEFNMFGLDLGYLGFSSDLTFMVSTNIDTYIFSGITAPLASETLDFYGFVANTGEYFTSFNISSAGGLGSAPVIDNVTLGNVPEPTALAFLGFSLLGLFGMQHQKKSVIIKQITA